MTVELTFEHMSQGHYASWNPEDPWTREHYCVLQLDKMRMAELDSPAKVEVIIRVVDDAET